MRWTNIIPPPPLLLRVLLLRYHRPQAEGHVGFTDVLLEILSTESEDSVRLPSTLSLSRALVNPTRLPI